MKEFKFVMNEYENVCYMFVDVNKPPVDTLVFIDCTEGYYGPNPKWLPLTDMMRDDFNPRTDSIDEAKAFYNDRYDEICEIFCPKDLLKLPERVNGYFLDPDTNKITKLNEMTADFRFGVVHTHNQAKGIAAFCEVSQILPNFNEGWKPDWDRTTIKHCIQTVEGELVIFATFGCRRLLAFETEKKAKLFLKEKIDLINDLRKAMII